MNLSNIFQLKNQFAIENEVFETLAGAASVRIERIVSSGQTTPLGTWLQESLHEWVILLQGEASLEFENQEPLKLCAGDYVLIPAGQKHRVNYTSSLPLCIWLAVHYQ